jgi:hypothetical protein
MKDVINGIGAVLMWLTGLLFVFDGLLLMNAIWGIAGVIIGVCIFPIPLIIGFCTIFTSFWAFVGAVVWFGLIALMIQYGE